MTLKPCTLSLSLRWTIQKRWREIGRDRKVVLINKGVKLVETREAIKPVGYRGFMFIPQILYFVKGGIERVTSRKLKSNQTWNYKEIEKVIRGTLNR